MAQGGLFCIKYILGVFNFAFFLSAVGIIALCVNAIGMPSSLEKVLELNNIYLFITIAASVFLLVLSFLGCCGALRENHCMLVSYGSLLLLIMLVEIGLGLGAVFYRYKVEELTVSGVKKYMERYEPGQDNSTTNSIIDDLQMSFKCCGSVNSSDWLNLNKTIPMSCCDRGSKSEIDTTTILSTTLSSIDSGNQCPSEKVFTRGCVETIRDKMIAYCNPIAGVLLTIGLIQLLGVVFSCVFAHSIKGGYQVV